MKIFLATCVATLLLLAIQPATVAAQEPAKDVKPAAADAKAPEANPPKEEIWPSDHTIKINGQSIAYKAVASIKKALFYGKTCIATWRTSLPDLTVCLSPRRRTKVGEVTLVRHSHALRPVTTARKYGLRQLTARRGHGRPDRHA